MHGGVGHLRRNPLPLEGCPTYGAPKSPYHMQIPLEHKNAQESIGDIWGFEHMGASGGCTNMRGI